MSVSKVPILLLLRDVQVALGRACHGRHLSGDLSHLVVLRIGDFAPAVHDDQVIIWIRVGTGQTSVWANQDGFHGWIV